MSQSKEATSQATLTLPSRKINKLTIKNHLRITNHDAVEYLFEPILESQQSLVSPMLGILGSTCRSQWLARPDQLDIAGGDKSILVHLSRWYGSWLQDCTTQMRVKVSFLSMTLPLDT